MARMPRPRAISRSDSTLIGNAEMARVFNEIADMLEISGELVYKAVAYRRVADAVERWPDDVAHLFQSADPPKIPGAGPALTTKLAELAATGQLGYYDKMRAQVPSGLLEILKIPGVGPRTVKQLHDELGIESVDSLRAAAESGTLRTLKGLSARTEENILAAMARLASRGTRLLLHDADALMSGLVEQLLKVRGVYAIEPAGSLRRRKATIGDLDLLAATDDPGRLIKALDRLTTVEHVLNAGTDKSSIVLADGPQVDLMVMRPGVQSQHLDATSMPP